MPARPALRRFRRAEYDRMVAMGLFQGERVELLHGVIVGMSPIGPPHATVVDRLNRTLVLKLFERALVRIQQPLAAWDDSEPEPDVSVVPLGDYSVDHPDRAQLVIEVADSSLVIDRETKVPLYAASCVLEYWIVNLVERVVEVYTDPEGPGYRSHRRARARDTVSPGAFPDLVLRVGDLLP